MPQLFPEGMRDPAEGEVLVSDEASISYGETWSMHIGSNCACGKDYPHLEVYGGRPRKIDGLETMMQWIRMALSVERLRYPIYTTDYGVEFVALIDRSPLPEEVETEAPRMIREAMLIDDRITEVREVRLEIAEEDPAAYFVDMEVVTFTGDLERIEQSLHLEA